MSAAPPLADPDVASTAVSRPARRPSRVRLALLGVCSALAILALGIVAAHARHRANPLPLLGAIPTFTMRDQRERPVTDATMHGAVRIVDFFFTSCPISCPRLTQRMADLGKTLAERHDDGVRLVSISVDPDNDTPAKLAEYARRYHADDDRWWFLSGDVDQLSRIVVQGFKVHYAKADPSTGINDIMHGNWFVLVDAGGQIRGYYPTDDANRLRELVDDAESLASDAR